MLRTPLRLAPALLAGGILTISSIASAQSTSARDEAAASFRNTVGTWRVEPFISSAGGVLSHCGLVFVALQRDITAKNESYVSLNGSFNVGLAGEFGPMFMLKLGVVDLPGDLKKKMQPANAFVRSPEGKVPKITKGTEDKGHGIFMGALTGPGADVYRGIVQDRVLEVGFNRVAGGSDTSIILDLTVSNSRIDPKTGSLVIQRSNDAVKQFITCTNRLFEDAATK